MAKQDDVDIPQDVIAIAWDTNEMPYGPYKPRPFERMQDVLDEQEFEDVVLWIPEPVVWEWAEHRYAAINQARSGYEKWSKDARRAGIEPPDMEFPEADVEELVAQFEQMLTTAGVEILRIDQHPEAAKHGLRDQILLTGVGRRKPATDDGVKTGASDSTSWRLIELAAGSDIANVVIITRDAEDTRRHFRGERSPVIASSRHSVERGLLRLAPGDTAAEEAVSEAIFEKLPSLLPDELSRASKENELNPFVWDDSWVTVQEDVSVTVITDVKDVTDIEVSRRDEHASAYATVKLTLEIDLAWWDERAEDLQQSVFFAEEIPAAAQVSAQRDPDTRGWSIEVDHFIIDDVLERTYIP